MPFQLKHPTPTETETQNACLRLLEADPRVAKAWRSSNIVRVEDGVPYKANTDSSGNLVTVSDLSGLLRGGHALAVEVKKSEAKWRSTEWFEAAYAAREALLVASLHGRDTGEALKAFDRSERGRLLRQWVHLEMVRKAGGFAACVWSSDMLHNLLDAYWDRNRRRLGSAA